MSGVQSNVTSIIPQTELTGIEHALVKADEITAQLEPILDKARSLEVKWPDQESYAKAGALLSEERSIQKNQIAPLFAPFEGIIQRAKDFIKAERLKRDNRCAQIEGLLVPKMKEYERAERDATAKEQVKINKAKPDDKHVSVSPNLPSIPGYRKTVTYKAALRGDNAAERKESEDVFLAAFLKAKDKERRTFLRKFIHVDEQELAKYARETKDSDALMKVLPGIYAWKE